MRRYLKAYDTLFAHSATGMLLGVEISPHGNSTGLAVQFATISYTSRDSSY